MTEPYPWESWEWDETLFEGAAPFYDQGRVPYAEGLADAFAEALGLDGSRRLLDVGCGPGVIALRVAHLFADVVGVDSDAGMIAEAVRIAAERGIANASWRCMRAEELPADLGIFDVVTFAQSFHWMDRARVARTARSMLNPGGAVVQVDIGLAIVDRSDTANDRELRHPSPPDEAIADLRRKYLGPHKRAGQGFRNTSPSGEDEVFQGAGFLPPQVVIVPDGRVITRSVDDLVSNAFSSSASAPHLFGDDVSSFEADLRELLAEASPSGSFSVWLPDNRLRIWRQEPG
jgi:SAM-dependent methyltransferase